jgi:hypothetical protein
MVVMYRAAKPVACSAANSKNEEHCSGERGQNRGKNTAYRQTRCLPLTLNVKFVTLGELSNGVR